MPATRKIHWFVVIHGAITLAVLCALLPYGASAQVQQRRPDELADAIAEVKGGNYAAIDRIVKESPTRAVPILQNLFSDSTDTDSKEAIAARLYTFGDKNGIYWDYLMQQAKAAVESDIPFPTKIDAQGKLQAQQSPALIAWANAHNVSLDSAAGDAGFILPLRVGILGGTHDPRAIPVLRQGLLSSDYMIVNAAAGGLGELRDEDSISYIIQACQRVPAELAPQIATSLIYFDDPRAQSTAEAYLPKETVTALRKSLREHGRL